MVERDPTVTDPQHYRRVDVSLPSGAAVWLAAQRHSGVNTGSTPTNTILIELKGDPAGTPSDAVLGPVRSD